MECLKEEIRKDLLVNAEYIHSLLIETHVGAYVPSGNNGPYLHIESPIRNTSHTLVLFRFAFAETSDFKYISAIEKLIEFIYKSRFRNGNRFLHRQTGPDSCNGIIGDAWLIEGLTSASQISDRLNPNTQEQLNELLDLLTSNVKFDHKNKIIYKRNDFYKGEISADYTYNHQLWYFASIASISNCKHMVSDFLDRSICSSLKVRNNGLIYHLLNTWKGKNIFNLLRYSVNSIRNHKAVDYKERGYHLFNMFAFAKIYKIMPEHPFFREAKFISTVEFLNENYFNKLNEEDNKYAIHYNAPAFELPLVYDCFLDNKAEIGDIVVRTYNKAKKDFSSDSKYINNKLDPMTYLCRTYELTYFLED